MKCQCLPCAYTLILDAISAAVESQKGCLIFSIIGRFEIGQLAEEAALDSFGLGAQ